MLEGTIQNEWFAGLASFSCKRKKTHTKLASMSSEPEDYKRVDLSFSITNYKSVATYALKKLLLDSAKCKHSTQKIVQTVCIELIDSTQMQKKERVSTLIMVTMPIYTSKKWRRKKLIANFK